MRVGVLGVELGRLRELGDRGRHVPARDLRLSECEPDRRRLRVGVAQLHELRTARSTCPAPSDCSALAALTSVKSAFASGSFSAIAAARLASATASCARFCAILTRAISLYAGIAPGEASITFASIGSASAARPDLRSTVARPITGASAFGSAAIAWR